MSYSHQIPPDQWSKIYAYLDDFPRLHTGRESNVKRFVEGVYWILRSGAQWRMLPPKYGDWNVVYQRFSNWAERGVWYKMLYYFAQDADMEYVMIDSTILRAHACAAGALKKNMAGKKTKD